MSVQSDIRNKKVFVRIEMDPDDVRSLSDNLRFASTQGAISNALEVQYVAQASLAYLRSKFPRSKDIPGGVFPTYTNGRLQKKQAYLEAKKSSKLDEGWEYTLSESEVAGKSASLLGFRLRHIKERQKRVQVILASLNYGSREHVITPKRRDWLKVGVPGGEPEEIFFWSKFLRIPARPGLFFVEDTVKWIEQRYGARKGVILDTLRGLIEKGVKPEKRLFSGAFIKAPRSPVRRATSVPRARKLALASNIGAAVQRIANSIRSLRIFRRG